MRRYSILLLVAIILSSSSAYCQKVYRVFQIQLPVIYEKYNDMPYMHWVATMEYDEKYDESGSSEIRSNWLAGVLMNEIMTNPKYDWSCDRFLLGLERYNGGGGTLRVSFGGGSKRYTLEEAKQKMQEALDAIKKNTRGSELKQYVVEINTPPPSEWSKYQKLTDKWIVQKKCN